MRDAGYERVRYADDFVLLCRSAEEAQEVWEHIRAWVESVGLTLHPEKTRIVKVTNREVLTSWGITSSAATADRARAD